MDILSELNSLKADYSAAQALLEEAKLTQEAVNKAVAEKESARTRLNELSASHAKDIEALNAVLGCKDSEIATLRAEVASLKGKQKSAEEKAVEMVAHVGIKPIKADYSQTDEPKDKAEVIAAIHALKDPVARANYYFAHKAVLFGK